MALNRVKALLADDMLHPAGVLGSDFRVDPKAGQPVGQQLVALINHLGDFTSRFGQV